MAELVVQLIPALSDNYIYLVRDPASSAVGVVDPATAEPVIAALDDQGLALTHIFNTHHHADHVGGNGALKARYGAPILGPRADRDRIPGIDIDLAEGDRTPFGTQSAIVLDTPGHTRGHISFHFPDGGALFCGDTLFALGCGRLFEGSPAQMWHSLRKLRDLPGDTRVYCGHEYTQSNARFCLTIEPDNDALARRAATIDAQRAEGQPTLPTTIALERATNPFLRPDQPAVRAALGMTGQDDVAVFTEIRRRKDAF